MGVRGTREQEYIFLRAGAFSAQITGQGFAALLTSSARGGFGVSHSRAADASAPLGLGDAAAAWRLLGLRGMLLAGPHVV